MSDELRILALDLAAMTGWAFSDGGPPLYGVWDLREGATDELRVLHDRIVTLNAEHGPLNLIAAEDAHMGTRNHLVAAQHSQRWGAVRLTASLLGARTAKVPPSTLKLFATGNGRAPKQQMIRACKTFFGIETDSDDIADALFVLEWARQNPNPPVKPKRKRRSGKRDRQRKLFR